MISFLKSCLHLTRNDYKSFGSSEDSIVGLSIESANEKVLTWIKAHPIDSNLAKREASAIKAHVCNLMGDLPTASVTDNNNTMVANHLHKIAITSEIARVSILRKLKPMHFKSTHEDFKNRLNFLLVMVPPKF